MTALVCDLPDYLIPRKSGVTSLHDIRGIAAGTWRASTVWSDKEGFDGARPQSAQRAPGIATTACWRLIRRCVQPSPQCH